jgi:diguanylate cyclase (GGDEF)-like protein
MMELQDSKTGLAAQAGGRKKYVAQVTDRLLTLICDQAKQDGGPEADQLCHRIRGYQLAMYESGMLDESVAQNCINDCTSYLDGLHTMAHAWTGEFKELLHTLQGSLAERSEDHQTFHNRIFESSDNFTRVANLQDVREIKEHLVRLVRDLRQTVIDQQKLEEKRNTEFSKRVQDLESKLEVARRDAETDTLTGIPNRAAFDHAFKRWMEHKKAFVVGMIDLDRFKSINDTYGHRVGDSALRCAAQWIRGNVHPDSFIARVGGDEFGVLLDAVSLPEAGKKFSDLLAEFSTRSYTCTNGEADCTVKFTMSCGLAEFVEGDTPATVIQRADEALHEAKKRRNRACTKRRSILPWSR